MHIQKHPVLLNGVGRQVFKMKYQRTTKFKPHRWTRR